MKSLSGGGGGGSAGDADEVRVVCGPLVGWGCLASLPPPNPPPLFHATSLTPPYIPAPITPHPQEEIVCAVCGEGHSDDDNKIVFCDHCDLAVHQCCYGVEHIPAGSWLCRLCEYGKDCNKVRCALCGHGGGAFKPTTAGDWAHIQCGIWLPDVSFTHPDRLENIDYSLMAPARRTLKCTICQQKKAGPCVQCPVGKCHISFHPWCLLYMSHPDIYVPPGEYEAYCKKHSPPPSERKPQLVLKVQEYYSSGKGPNAAVPAAPTGPRGGGRGGGGGRGMGRGGGGRGRGGGRWANRGSLGGLPPLPGRGGMARGGGRASGRNSPRIFGGAGSVASEGGGGGDEVSSVAAFAGAPSGGVGGDGLVVPLFSEYPGQHLNEQLDLDHFWSAVNIFFPDDHPREFLDRIRSSILPVDAPAGAATDDDHSIFRFPKVDGGRRRRRPRRKEAKASSSETGGEDEEEEEEESVVCMDQEDEDDEAHLSDASYEDDEERPADAFLSQLKRRLRLRHQEDGEGGGGGALAKQVADLGLQEKKSGRSGVAEELQVLFQASALSHQLRCTFKDTAAAAHGHAHAPGGRCCADVELARLEKVDVEEAAAARVTIDVEMVQPNYVDLELMSHQQELSFVSSAIRHRVDGMMERILADHEGKEKERQEAATVERRYLLARVWKFVAQGLHKGLQDQSPDFNKHKEEALPASWTVQVDGRPPPPAPEALAAAARGWEEDDDSICMVCFDGSSTENNEIVFCDGCNVAVHQSCYGLAEVPEGDFYCEKCVGLMENPERPIVCALCPEVHGGFKRTVDGKWVHLVCAMVCPGVRITNLADMGPVDLSGAGALIKQASATSPFRHPPPLLLPLPTLTAPAAAGAPGAPVAAEEKKDNLPGGGGGGGGGEVEGAASPAAVVVEGETKDGAPEETEVDGTANGKSSSPAAAAPPTEEAAPPTAEDKKADEEVAAMTSAAADTPAAAASSSSSSSSSPKGMAEGGGEKKPTPVPTSARRTTRSSPTPPATEEAAAVAPEEGEKKKEQSASSSPAKREGKGEEPSDMETADAKEAPVVVQKKGESGGAAVTPPPMDLLPAKETSTALTATPTARVDQCVVCCQSRGHTFECSHEGCSTRFHLLCAWFRGAFVSVDLTDRSFWGQGESHEEYPAGLRVEAYCLAHCPEGKRDRMEQIQLRTKYRLKENDGPKRHAHKKRAYTYGGMQGGKSLGGFQGLNPDSYHRYACAICMEPKAKLLQEEDDEEEPTALQSQGGDGAEESKEGEPPKKGGKKEPAEGLLVCSKCEMSVHRSCHSFFQDGPTTPEAAAKWVCQTCVGEQQDMGSGGSCVLCPRRGGLLVPTNDRNVRWVHAFCAEHNGPLVFKSGPSPVLPELTAVDVRSVGKDAKKASKCGVCSKKNSGLCLRCACPGCSVQYHPLCAKLDGWHFQSEARGEAPFVLCPGHVPDGIYRGFNGQYFDMKTTHRLRRNLDRARLIVDLVRKREKVKKALWKTDCELSEKRLEKLKVLVTTRMLEMGQARRLTEDRLVAYRQELDALAAPSTGAQEDKDVEALLEEAERHDKAAATAAAANDRRRRYSSEAGGGGGSSKRPRLDLSVVIPSGRPTRSSTRNTPQNQSAASSVCGDVPTAADVSLPVLPTLEAPAAAKKRSTTPAAAPAPAPAAPAASPPASSTSAAKPAAAAAAPVPVEPAPMAKKSHHKKKVVAVKEEEEEEAPPAKVKVEPPPPAKAKPAPVDMTKEKEEEEDDDDGELLARDRFEALTEEKGLAAATALEKAGSALWGAAGKRVGAYGRVDFEKSVGLVLDPEDLRKREKRMRPSAVPVPGVSPESRVSLDRQLLELVSALEDCKDPSGRDVSATFEVAPDPEAYPDYYDAVQMPVDLETLRHRVQTFFYPTMQDFCKDVTQLVRNAKKFNAPKSQAYLDADFLKGFFDTKKAEVMEREREALAALHGDAANGGGSVSEDGASGRAQRRRVADAAAAAASSSASALAPVDAGSKKNKRKSGGGGGGRLTRATRAKHKEERVCRVCSSSSSDAPLVVQGACHVCAACVQSRPQVFLGQRVMVYWDQDKTWFVGKVRDFDPLTGQHRIWYDDGEWEFVDLSEQELSFLDPVTLRGGDTEEKEEGGKQPPG